LWLLTLLFNEASIEEKALQSLLYFLIAKMLERLFFSTAVAWKLLRLSLSLFPAFFSFLGFITIDSPIESLRVVFSEGHQLHFFLQPLLILVILIILYVCDCFLYFETSDASCPEEFEEPRFGAAVCHLEFRRDSVAIVAIFKAELFHLSIFPEVVAPDCLLLYLLVLLCPAPTLLLNIAHVLI
jgi:hypothetical protein